MIKKFHLIIVLGLVVFHIISNFFWLRLNQEPLFDDDARHLLNGLTCIDIIRTPSAHVFKNLLGQFDRDYPPVFSLASGAMSMFFGRTTVALKMSNAIFWAILLFSLYGLGKKIAGENAALLAVFITSMYPAVFGFSRAHLLEFSLIAMVTLSVCLLLYSENFTRKKISILFGLSLGLGMLTKVTFCIFIFGPLFYIVWQILYRLEINIKAKAIENLFLSFLVGLGIMSFWYIPRIYNLSLWRDYFIQGGFVRGKYFSTPDVLSFESVSYYLSRLYADQLLPVFTVIFFLAAMMAIIRKKRWVSFLSLWIIVPYIGLTLIITKTVRYPVAYLPAIGIISAIGIYQIKSRFLKSGAILLIIAFSLIQYGLLSYCGAVNEISVKSPVSGKKILLWQRPDTYTLSPRSGNWHFEDISAIMLKESSMMMEPSMGLTYTRREEINPGDFRENWVTTNRLGWLYYIKLKKLPFSTYILRNLHPEDRQGSLILPDFIIASDNLNDYSNLVRMKKDKYRLLNIFKMPDNSEIKLYKIIDRL